MAAGVDAEQIKRWLASGWLRPVHKGVYAVGHAAPSLHADYMAAVLACGEGAVISHRAAAHLLALLPGRRPPPEVTVPTTAGRRRPGVVIHRVRALPARDRTTIDGIPATTAPRTLLDLATPTAKGRNSGPLAYARFDARDRRPPRYPLGPVEYPVETFTADERARLRAACHEPRPAGVRARQPARDRQGRAVRALLALPRDAAAAVPRRVRRRRSATSPPRPTTTPRAAAPRTSTSASSSATATTRSPSSAARTSPASGSRTS